LAHLKSVLLFLYNRLEFVRVLNRKRQKKTFTKQLLKFRVRLINWKEIIFVSIDFFVNYCYHIIHHWLVVFIRLWNLTTIEISLFETISSNQTCCCRINIDRLIDQPIKILVINISLDDMLLRKLIFRFREKKLKHQIVQVKHDNLY